MKRVKPNRLKKFKKHTSKILKYFVDKICKNEIYSVAALSKAIDGILYQYLGDEEKFLSNNLRNQKVKFLEGFIADYRNMDENEIESISKNLACGEVRKDKVLNAHIMEIVFGVINKESPRFFFYSDDKNSDKSKDGD